MQVLWLVAGLLPPCLLWDLHCTPSGVVILCPPPVCCVAVCLVCTCLILWIVFGRYFVVLATVVAQGCYVVSTPWCET